MPDPDPHEARAREPAGAPARNVWQAAATLLLGATIIAWLTRYNLHRTSVWSLPGAPIPYSWEEYLVVNTTGLMLLPLLLILAAFRRSPWEFGMRPPEPGTARIAWLFYAAMVPILWWVAHRPDFQLQYPLYPGAAANWHTLATYELTYGFYLFCWEFFYRGFLTFGMARGWGSPAAVVLQALGFGIMHLGKPTPEFLSSFPGGLIMGWLAVRTQSFLPGFALHWAISATLDVLVIATRHV